MPLLVSFLLSFSFAFMYAGIVYWTDRYEKEPRLLLVGSFLWGAILAAGVAYVVNTIFGVGIFFITNDEVATDLIASSFVAPVVEEGLKGLAIYLIYLAFRREFDSVLDGLVYAAIVALGFAATENVLYLYDRGFLEDGWEGLWILFVIRIILGGWNHALYTSFIGIGLAVARLSRSAFTKLAAPLAGFGVAISIHALHNFLASVLEGLGGLALIFGLDWLGWLVVGGILIWAIRRERGWIASQLKEEVENGVISITQYHTALSPAKRRMAAVNALFGGQGRATRQFYHYCTELAYKKQQTMQLGERKENNTAMILRLRERVAALAVNARA